MNAYSPLPLNELPVWDPPTEAVETLYREALRSFSRKMIVLDDDPTGTQTVHGVKVYTNWSYECVLDCFQDGAAVSYILTNSRSFTSAHTELVHWEVAEHIHQAAAQTGRDYVLLSRGDSTMRGHWPLETQVMTETLARRGGKCFDGEIVLPAFMEGGRFTFGNVHYVKDGEILLPAGESEFAKDATFGYRSSNLADWCEEKTCGTYRADACICISLEDIRSLNIEKISAQLMEAANFAKIIVNAVCYEDLKVFCAAYIKALNAGKEFIFRTAASWVKVLGGISDKALLTHEELTTDTAYGGIILVGSYVNKTAKQLEALQNSGLPIQFVEFQAALVADGSSLKQEVDRVVSVVEESIRQGTTVAVYTTRQCIDLEGLSKEQRLQVSVAISDAVTSIIGKLHIRPAFIVAKGGITSSDVAVKALKIKSAAVMGQIMPGIPVWMTGEESKFPDLPYVVFPGNVGEAETLSTVVGVLMESI